MTPVLLSRSPPMAEGMSLISSSPRLTLRVASQERNPLFTIQNSGKKLTSINLKNPDGKAAFFKMLDEADVFITNVRAAALGRLGLDYETLHERYPGLVYAHLSGFGPKGPDAANPGFDSTAFWLRPLRYSRQRSP